MSTALVILAKAPASGFAKTRLIPALGPEGAAAIAQNLLIHAITQALASGFEHVELCVSPDPDHPALRHVLVQIEAQNEPADQSDRPLLHLSTQSAGDLGQRMHEAILRNLACHREVLLMGTDAPSLTTCVLKKAREALADAPAVFVPAHDGGYALVGLSAPARFLFENMTWSTPDVMNQTRKRLQAHGWEWLELESVPDIDEPADLQYLPRNLQP